MKLSLCALFVLPFVCFAQDEPVVETIYGRILGVVNTTEAGSIYEAYLGIPYATPPLDDLRFAKSVPPERWEGILDTTEFASGCIEVNNNTETSEDCLYLNVYVPGRNRSGDGLAVMVWAHGGAFFFGRGSHYPGQDLAIHGDLIVVTINYRLGALGFLSTEDEVAPGNYGLWDVKLALEWVRDNIVAFGGSPDRVTMFGQSAGGAITSHVMISPETQGLLARGICISGSSSAYFASALPGAVASSSRLLGRTLGCPNNTDSETLIECLRQEDPNDINYWGLFSVILFKQQVPNFIPVIDGEFIPQHPANTWNESAPTNLGLITGATIDDGAAFVLIQSTNDPNITINLAATKVTLDGMIRVVMNPYPGDYGDIKEALINQYPGIDDNDTITRTQAASQFTTDWWFDVGAHYEASHHSSASQNTYLYEYAYPNSFLRKFIDEEYEWMTADHSDDLYMVWGEEFSRDYRENVLNGEFSNEDKEMSSQMMSYYTNFAKTGNPNEGMDVPVQWPQFTRESREYLQFAEDTQVLTQTEEQLDNYRFWVREFPNIANP